ncbi:MAG: hypothetical protein HS115_17370 [Spirochaetales bacterium]|nr:hypothetical protein [Spirochaetales bacterium]
MYKIILIVSLVIFSCRENYREDFLDLTKETWIACYNEDRQFPPVREDQKNCQSVLEFPVHPAGLFHLSGGEDLHAFALRARFSLDAAQMEKLHIPAFYFPALGEYWEIYLNGRLIDRSHNLSILFAEGLLPPPRFVRGHVLPFSVAELKEENQLLIHVAGYGPGSRWTANRFLGLGVSAGYVLGPLSRVLQKRSDLIGLALYGSYVLFGLYHMLLFLLQRRQRYNLYFGLFSLSLAAFLFFFSYHSYELFNDGGKILQWTYILQPFALSFFLLFLNAFFVPQKVLSLLRVSLVLNGLIVLALLIFPYRLYQTILQLWYLFVIPQLLFLIWFMVQSVWRKREDALAIAGGLLFAVTFMVWDILDTLLFFTGVRLMTYGHLAIVLVLTGTLARRHSRMSRHAEDSALDMEKRVQERTLELHRAWGQLERAYRTAERSHNEIEKLNDLNRVLNNTADYDEVLVHIFAFIERVFRIEGAWLFHVRGGCFSLAQLSSESLNRYSDETILFFTENSFSAEAGSVIGESISRKRPQYMRRIDPERATSVFDRAVVEKLKIESVLVLPLLTGGSVIAVLLLTRYKERLRLGKEEIRSIMRFCDQVAGVLSTASLFAQVKEERSKSDALLRNIFPAAIAEELRTAGRVRPRRHESVTVLFTDFKSFTSETENMPIEELVEDLDAVFEQFDRICARYGIEKLKTIGDSYMAAGGLTVSNHTHPVDTVLAAMEIMDFAEQVHEIRQAIAGSTFWRMRIGIHTGPVVSGVIGQTRFAYDIWGDAVNVASRMESSGEPGRINLSRDTYDLIKYFFDCESRGSIPIKNHGSKEMFFLTGIRHRLSSAQVGRLPDANFHKLYQELKSGARLAFRSELDNRQRSSP